MPTVSEALTTAIAAHQAGRLQAAAEIYQQILAIQPQHADALHLLGLVAHQLGQHETAVVYLGRAIAVSGNAAVFHHHLGEAYRGLGRLPQAVAAYERALQLQPGLAAAWNGLGIARKCLGQFDAAVACYRRALECQPEYLEAYVNWGNALLAQARWQEAAECCRRALGLRADCAEAHNNLGAALQGLGEWSAATDCFRRALECQPDFAAACSNLGAALSEQGALDEAVACCRRAVQLNPLLAEAHGNLGTALRNLGELEEALACHRRALELRPSFAAAHSNLLLTLQYCAGVAPATLAAAHADYDRRHAAPLRSAGRPHDKAVGRRGRLRLGFVSPDLGRHPVGYFLLPVLEHLSPQVVETICYSDRTRNDDWTQRLQAAAHHWREAAGMTDEQLAERVRDDQVDVLFDLAGHTAHNRLLVFARKPAPIQVTWLGYVGTTGLGAIDYLLADRYEIPPGAEAHYREQVLRMPDGYVCYAPPDDAPLVARLPALDGKPVTLGCFNSPAKINPETLAVWAAILRRLPEARLVFRFRGGNEPSLVRRFAARFSAHGVAPARLEFLGYAPHLELLAEYQRIDLALDPFPYSGGLTTCEALWMGVPVITCPQETFASRHSLSHLSNVGLPELVADDLDDYVERTVSLAEDLPRLAALRGSLRQRMAASPLCDGARFATHLEAVVQELLITAQ